VESIHVLIGIDGQKHGALVHLRRERKLHKDSIDIRPGVQVVDDLQDVPGGRVGRHLHLLGVDARLRTGFDF